MRRFDQLLSPGERVHLVTREHGTVLVRPFLRATAILTVLAGAALRLSSMAVPGVVRWTSAVLLALLAAHALLRLAAAVGRWHARRLVITDRRALLLSGGFGRRVSSVPLRAVLEVEVMWPGLGRMLRYGALVVNVNGSRGPLLGLRRLPDPDLLMGLLLGLADEATPRRAHRRRAGTVAAPSGVGA
ncbi:MAG: PH domain-containing protein [Gaiellales bacterium]